ncbi:hypothetical protein L2E82_25040 [Cichorium intybus]|uniref:Uncharacterized protein n=1 Tax=Cichorium intybus TaxID=13427 RepID=A0ACB9E3E6_CICIN|nr:hypothetical protein L2E82_25040 [Cichorium intybus]
MPAVDGGSFWPVQSPPVVSQFHCIEDFGHYFFGISQTFAMLSLWTRIGICQASIEHFLIFDESASAFWSFLNLSLDFNYIGIYQMTKLLIMGFTALIETFFLKKQFRVLQFSTVKAHWDEKLEDMKEFEEESEKLMKLHEREEVTLYCGNLLELPLPLERIYGLGTGFQNYTKSRSADDASKAS